MRVAYINSRLTFSAEVCATIWLAMRAIPTIVENRGGSTKVQSMHTAAMMHIDALQTSQLRVTIVQVKTRHH